MNKTWITECVFIMDSGFDYGQDQRMSTLIWPGQKSVCDLSVSNICPKGTWFWKRDIAIIWFYTDYTAL